MVHGTSSMYKVVDFGALVSEQLCAFFSSSDKNVAVLTDMMAIESLKQKKLRHHQVSLEVLSRNEKRVVILKPSGVAARLRPNFAEFPNNLMSAKPGTLRNDGIDMFYVAYGTAVDGVISEDIKLTEIFDLARSVLLV
jgi:hypothetical protein